MFPGGGRLGSTGSVFWAQSLGDPDALLIFFRTSGGPGRGVSPPHSVASVCPSVPSVHLSTLQPRTYVMSSTSSCLQQEFLAPRGQLYSRRASHMWHIFSACCKQAHVCVTYLVTTVGGLPNVGGPTAVKLFFISMLICFFSFVLFFPGFFFCVLLVYVSSAHLWGVYVSLIFCMGMDRAAQDRTAQCGTWHRWAWHARCVCCGYFKMLCSCSVLASYHSWTVLGPMGLLFLACRSLWAPLHFRMLYCVGFSHTITMCLG